MLRWYLSRSPRFYSEIGHTVTRVPHFSGFDCIYECSRIEKVQAIFPGNPYLVTFPKIKQNLWQKARKDKLIRKYFARVNAIMLHIRDGFGCGGWKVRIVIIQGK